MKILHVLDHSLPVASGYSSRSRSLGALTPRPPFQRLIMSVVDRLGREQIDTTYLLKQIIAIGGRVFDYLDVRSLPPVLGVVGGTPFRGIPPEVVHFQ